MTGGALGSGSPASCFAVSICLAQALPQAPLFWDRVWLNFRTGPPTASPIILLSKSPLKWWVAGKPPSLAVEKVEKVDPSYKAGKLQMGLEPSSLADSIGGF